jgi:hypothetical protein
MSLTISTKTYSQDRIAPDAVSYAGPANTLSSKDIVELKRVYPKPVKDFAGVARPSIKTTRTCTLADGVTKVDAILMTSGSLPVGISDADASSLIADHLSMLTLENAGTTKVIKNLDITY